MKKPSLRVAGLATGVALFAAGCATITAPFRDADPRWADYKSWTMVNEGEPSTGDPTGFIGTVHAGSEGYRNVYVNDVGEEMLLGDGPYNFPEGTVIVKEQFASRDDWEAGKGASHTVSVKVSESDEISVDNWRWASSYKGSAETSDFCAGCHAIAAKDDYAFTNGTFLATQ